MATKKELELEQRIEELTQQLTLAGLISPTTDPKEEITNRKDYIAHGSEEHAVFLGLIVLEGDEEIVGAQETGFFTFRSPETNKTYRLEDQLTPFMTFPDPAQVAKLVLMQKVSSLESGKPVVPDDALPLWRPPVNANY